MFIKMMDTLHKLMLFFLVFFGILLTITAGLATSYHIKYDIAIQEGAENVMIALKMVVACQQLSNVTSDQIKEQYINTFILNKTNEQAIKSLDLR
jgi:hypothetical protein